MYQYLLTDSLIRARYRTGTGTPYVPNHPVRCPTPSISHLVIVMIGLVWYCTDIV